MGHRKTPNNQGDEDPAFAQFFTSESVLDLIDKISATLQKITARRKRNRFFFLEKRTEAERHLLKTSTLLSKVLSYERCPGLTCRIRAVSLPVTGRRHTARLKPFILLDFVQYPVSTAQESRDALDQPTPQTAQGLNTLIKKITVEVGFSGSKQRKVLRMGDGARIKFVDLLRFSDKKRIRLNKHSRRWRRIYVDPKQSLNEIRLHLLLYLRQEQMIEPSLDENLIDLVAECFKLKDRYNNHKWMVESAKSTALLLLSELLTHFTYPEDWRAIRKYVRRVKSTYRTKGFLDFTPNLIVGESETGSRISDGKDPRRPEHLLEDPEEAQANLYSESIWDRPFAREHTQNTGATGELYTVAEAANLLQAKGMSVSRDRIYDWINAGIIKYKLASPDGRPGMRRRRSRMRFLDPDGIAALERQLSLSRQRQSERRVVFDCLQERGMSKEAIRKFIYRHQKQGESLVDIGRARGLLCPRPSS